MVTGGIIPAAPGKGFCSSEEHFLALVQFFRGEAESCLLGAQEAGANKPNMVARERKTRRLGLAQPFFQIFLSFIRPENG